MLLSVNQTVAWVHVAGGQTISNINDGRTISSHQPTSRTLVDLPRTLGPGRCSSAPTSQRIRPLEQPVPPRKLTTGHAAIGSRRYLWWRPPRIGFATT